jgi:hypothetical protein
MQCGLSIHPNYFVPHKKYYGALGGRGNGEGDREPIPPPADTLKQRGGERLCTEPSGPKSNAAKHHYLATVKLCTTLLISSPDPLVTACQ